MFPLKNYKHNIPQGKHPGAFGSVRRYDIHTGVDLYCTHGDEVYAIEDGIITNIENFTGEWADSPWWNNTQSIMIQGNSGVILYGEVELQSDLEIGAHIQEGALLGKVLTVLKKDKGKPMCMLHVELYSKPCNSVWWSLGSSKPKHLQDITPVLIINI